MFVFVLRSFFLCLYKNCKIVINKIIKHEGGNWKNGKLDGLFESFHENGQLCERRNYIDGELDGLQEGYHENGQLVERRNYKNGKKDGLWEKYNKYNGDILKTEEYKNGVLQE